MKGKCEEGGEGGVKRGGVRSEEGREGKCEERGKGGVRRGVI